jgi:hypothetical protein
LTHLLPLLLFGAFPSEPSSFWNFSTDFERYFLLLFWFLVSLASLVPSVADVVGAEDELSLSIVAVEEDDRGLSVEDCLVRGGWGGGEDLRSEDFCPCFFISASCASSSGKQAGQGMRESARGREGVREGKTKREREREREGGREREREADKNRNGKREHERQCERERKGERKKPRKEGEDMRES